MSAEDTIESFSDLQSKIYQNTENFDVSSLDLYVFFNQFSRLSKNFTKC